MDSGAHVCSIQKYLSAVGGILDGFPALGAAIRRSAKVVSASGAMAFGVVPAIEPGKHSQTLADQRRDPDAGTKDQGNSSNGDQDDQEDEAKVGMY